MKFRRWPRIEAFNDTPLKRAAFHRKMADQQNRFPLLAALIRERQPDVDEEMARRSAQWLLIQQSERDRRAADWRRARARIAGLGGNVRPVVTQLWGEAPYPADPIYLLDMLHGIDIGRIDIDKPPWRFTAEEIAAGRKKLETFLERCDEQGRHLGCRLLSPQS